LGDAGDEGVEVESEVGSPVEGRIRSEFRFFLRPSSGKRRFTEPNVDEGEEDATDWPSEVLGRRSGILAWFYQYSFTKFLGGSFLKVFFFPRGISREVELGAARKERENM
jgi:hypothetical protein